MIWVEDFVAFEVIENDVGNMFAKTLEKDETKVIVGLRPITFFENGCDNSRSPSSRIVSEIGKKWLTEDRKEIKTVFDENIRY